jgi:hypothetical protein
MSEWRASAAEGTSDSFTSASMAVYGPLLPVHERQLLEELQPVSRFVPRPAASECRAVVISARCPAEVDPLRSFQKSSLTARIGYLIAKEPPISDCDE